jgi:hypothetical protein
MRHAFLLTAADTIPVGQPGVSGDGGTDGAPAADGATVDADNVGGWHKYSTGTGPSADPSGNSAASGYTGAP